MALLTGLFLVCLFFPPANVLFSSQKSIIFNEGKDWFADFFNVMRYMSDDGGLYYSKINESDGHSGFPLGQVLIYPLTLLVDYSRMSLEDCWMSKPAIFSCVVYLAVLAFFFWDSLNRVCEKYGVKKYNLIIFLFSSAFIFTLERGNNLFLSAALVNYFLVFYDSRSKGQKWFALVSLCLAATLKGYPVFFGLLLLKDKRYKDILYCIIITIILAFGPFLFMEGGFDNLFKMIENTGLNNEAYLHVYNYMFGLHKLACLACFALHLPPMSMDSVISVVRILETALVLLTFILVLVEKRIYRQILLIVCAVVLFPINSGFYCVVYVLPAILLFFIRREYTKLDYVILLLLCLVINPFQVVLPFNGHEYYLTSLMSNASLCLLWLLLIATSLPQLKGFKFKQLI